MIMEVTFEKTRRGLTRAFKGVALVDGKVVCGNHDVLVAGRA